jgi:hypothetical protein
MFRVATFGRSFHWMDHERLAPAVLEVLEPGGALVVLFDTGEGPPDLDRSLRHPLVPRAAIEDVLQHYLGAPARRSRHDQRFAMLQDVPPILARAGFVGPEQIWAEGRELFVRTADDVIAFYYSRSSSAPSLFGDQLAKFEADFRRVLAEASPSGLFSEQSRDTEVLIWRKPGR